MNQQLTSSDLARLNKKYFNARANWKSIGLYLGISTDDLEAIDRNNRGICEDCFLKVLIGWLRKEGIKTESELAQASKRAEISKSGNIYLFSAAFVAVLLACIAFGCKTYVERNDPLITAAQNLKEWYKTQPVIDFKLLEYASDMQFINMTTKNEDIWKLLHDIDSEHQKLQIQPTTQSRPPGLKRLLIKGHPGAGKTTLMRYLAKEWANGTVLQSCKILFLIHLDALQPKDSKPVSLSELLVMSPLKDDLGNIEQITKEILSRHGAGACFLLDSYDGWHWRNDFINELIFKGKLHSSLCLLTSRPSDFTLESNIIVTEIVGFNASCLEEYLDILSTDRGVTNSILDLWKRNQSIKEMCILPLNMVMLMFIAKYREHLTVHTKTQVYVAFMYATVKHFAPHHPHWNVVSLKECILDKGNDNELCDAFKHIHYVAFEMVFHQVDKFPEYPILNTNVQKLGFVNVTKVDSTEDLVKYTFSHPTFREFFAAIHLMKIPREKRFYYFVEGHAKTNFYYWFKFESTIWSFYFGLIGTYWSSISNVSTALKQISMFTRDEPHLDELYARYIPEIGWKGEKLDELLESTGIVVNSMLLVNGIHNPDMLQYLLLNAKIQKLTRYYSGHLYSDDNGLVLDTSESHFQSILTCLQSRSFLMFVGGIIHLIDPLASDSELKCLKNIAPNLQMLSLALSIDCFSDSKEGVGNYIRSFEGLPRNLTLKLKVVVSIYDGDGSCPVLLYLLSKIRHLNLKVQKFVLSLYSVMARGAYGRKHTFSIVLEESPGKYLQLFDELDKLLPLELFNYYMGRSEIDRASQNLPHALQELNLCSCCARDNFSVNVLAVGLKQRPELKSLRLCKNDITEFDLIPLVDALKLHKNFSSLDLSYNSFLGLSSVFMSDSYRGLKALRELTNLRELNLQHTNVNVGVLLEVFASSNTLHSLSITTTCYSGIQSLAQLSELRLLKISDSCPCNSRIIQSMHAELSSQIFDAMCPDELWIEYDCGKTLFMKTLEKLTKLQSLWLCQDTDVRSLDSTPVYWTIDLAKVIVDHLPELQLFRAPCL